MQTYLILLILAGVFFVLWLLVLFLQKKGGKDKSTKSMAAQLEKLGNSTEGSEEIVVESEETEIVDEEKETEQEPEQKPEPEPDLQTEETSVVSEEEQLDNVPGVDKELDSKTVGELMEEEQKEKEPQAEEEETEPEPEYQG